MNEGIDPKLAKNNPTDIKAYSQFMKEQKETLDRVHEKTLKLRTEKNLSDWNARLAWPWNKADLDFFQGRNVERIKEMIRTKDLSHMVMSGFQNGGKSFFTHAVIKEMIKAGIVSPSEIKWTSVREGVNNINGMFNSRQWKDDFFTKNAKILVIDGCSMDFTNLDNKDNDRFWRELIEFAREANRLIIINYTEGNKENTINNVNCPTVSKDRNITLYILKGAKIFKIGPESKNPDKVLTLQ